MRSPLKQFLRLISVQAPCALAVFLGVSLLSPLGATITNVQLKTSLSSPQPLGTTIKLTASATDTAPAGPLSYKWELELPGSTSFSTLEDFDELNTFTWVPNYSEGAYQLRLTARDHLAGTSAQTVVTFNVTPLVTGTQPVAVTTANPLVALFSAPNCPTGSTMNVVFQQEGLSTQTSTDARACHAGTQNFYIGGMRPSTTYTMFSQVTTGAKTTNGPQISFTTGTLSTTLTWPTRTVPVLPGSGIDLTSDIILTDFTAPPYFPLANDLSGNVVWYYSTPLQMTRPVPGGTFLAIPNGVGTGTSVWGTNVTRQQLIREFDIAGNIIHETNCDRVYEQLQAMGLTQPLGRFDHDAIRLQNGETMVLGDVQEIFPAGTQGSTGPIDIIGDVIILLDDNFQVLWYWNTFDHDCSGTGCININRPGDAECVTNPTTGLTAGGCPPVLLSSPANDWTHANSIQYLTTDGDILLSLRNQNWIAKIDYNNGIGTGDILWELGLDGNFTLEGSLGEPYPWFSGQHNPAFIDNGETTLVVFDNGATRVAKYGGDSRGQVWTINETAMTATLTLNNDLGAYSPALGSAQLMLNGNFNFFAGENPVSGATKSYQAETTEFSPTGTIEYQYAETSTSQTYRGWRLASLYESSYNGSGGPENVQ